MPTKHVEILVSLLIKKATQEKYLNIYAFNYTIDQPINL
jgi:hypothetical protein